MKLPIGAQVYLGGISFGACVALVCWLSAWPAPLPAPSALMVLLAVLAIAAIHFPLLLAPQVKIDVTVAVYFALLLLLGPPTALLIVAACHLTGGITLGLRRNPLTGQRRRDPLSTLFNTAQMIIAVALGGVVYYGLMPGGAPADLRQLANLWAIPAAAATMYLANTGAVAAMAGLAMGESPVEVWLAEWRVDALQFAGLFLIGLAGALTGAVYPWAPLLLALPTAIIYVSLKRTVELGAQTVAAVEALADMIDLRDPSTHRHSERVARYAEGIARRLDLPGDQIAQIRLAARVHDLGKIGIPDAVLFKPGRLDPDERAAIERHSELGAQVLARFPQYRQVRELVLAHHERHDGTGYPRRLARERIPLGAYIIGAADAFEAMTADRPYRRGMSPERALAELRRGAGTQFHPAVVVAFEAFLREERELAPADALARPSLAV